MSHRFIVKSIKSTNQPNFKNYENEGQFYLFFFFSNNDNNNLLQNTTAVRKSAIMSRFSCATACHHCLTDSDFNCVGTQFIMLNLISLVNFHLEEI